MAEYHIQSKTRFIVTGTNSASNIRKAMTVLFNLLDSAGPGADDDLEEAGTQLDDPSSWLNLDDSDLATLIDGGSGRRLHCFARSPQLVVRDGLDSVFKTSNG